jgi:hypothetical protein
VCFPNPTKAGPFKRSGFFVPPHNYIDILLYLGVWLGILGGPRLYRRLKARPITWGRADGTGFQPSICARGRFLGHCPRLGWCGPLGLYDSTVKQFTWIFGALTCGRPDKPENKPFHTEWSDVVEDET